MSDVEPKYRVVVMGKTGSGKSSVCNRLIGHKYDDVFPVYSGMGGRTTQFQSHYAVIDGVCIEVVDTPDFFSMEHDVSSARAEFFRLDWNKVGPSCILTAILFAVPIDYRFSSEDNILYNEKYMKILPEEYRNNLINGYTTKVVDSVNKSIKKLYTLQNLDAAAKGRRLVFPPRENANVRQLQRDLIAMLDTMRMEHRIVKKIPDKEPKLAAVFRYAKKIAVQYIVMPGKTTATRVASFCRKHRVRLTFSTVFVVVLYSVYWVTWTGPASPALALANATQPTTKVDIAKPA